MIGIPILCAMFGQGIDKDIVTLIIELSFACIMLIVWVFVWVDSHCTDPPVIKEVIPSITAQQGGPYMGFSGKRYIEEVYMLNKIHNMDCLEGMKLLADKSIDMILCDLPYGTTQNSWDELS